MLDDRVRRIGEDLGGTVAASYYREGKPEKEIAVLGEEIDAGLIMLGGQRQAPLEGISGANLVEKVPRTAVASKVICRTFKRGGTRIRTGDTMIFSHIPRPLDMR